MRINSMFHGKLLAFTAALAGVLALSARAEAAPNTHDGFYLQLDVGLGYLTSTASGTGFRDTTLSGVTLPTALLLGGTVGPVVIGGGFFTDFSPSPSGSVDGQTVELTDVSMTLIGIGMFADYYVQPQGGLHFQPFVGWGGLETTFNGNSGGSDPTGLILALGGGYDFFISEQWSFGGMVRVAYAPLKLNDVSYSTLAPALLATFTYH